MNESTDRALEAWLRQGPEEGSGTGLQRALSLTRATRQRPRWAFPERWLSRRRVLPTQKLLYLVLLAFLIVGFLIATMLVGAGRRVDTPFLPVVVENDPIPLPRESKSELVGLVEAWGNRLDDVDAAAPRPRVSAAQATAIAGRSFLGTLRANNIPVQDVTVPDGLWRGRYVVPREAIQATVWVVSFHSDVGFNCLDASGGPGPCGHSEAIFVDDQTGEIVAGYSTGGP